MELFTNLLGGKGFTAVGIILKGEKKIPGSGYRERRRGRVSEGSKERITIVEINRASKPSRALRRGGGRGA